MAKSAKSKERAAALPAAGKEPTVSATHLALPAERAAKLATRWWLPCKKKLLLIRPRIPGDTYTEQGSFLWADAAKAEAIAKGWVVTDLDANNATREEIENALNTVKPHLVLHYDHGSDFTLWGQENNVLEPGLDDRNIALASGHIVSTVSCLSANGLGPLSITQGVVSYIGYTDLHWFWTHRAAEFGQAANAANFKLLEGETAQEAFDAGWTAYDQLYVSLLAAGDLLAAASALHDRDCLALLGSASSVAPPLCACPFSLPLHCKVGLPDAGCRHSLQLHCVIGAPDSGCKALPFMECSKALPAVLCRQGNPMLACTHGSPVGQLCGHGLPVEEQLCTRGLPGSMPTCGAGPDGCSAGPPLIVKEILPDYPDDLVIVDRDKIPPSMRKAFDNMLERIQQEGR